MADFEDNKNNNESIDDDSEKIDDISEDNDSQSNNDLDNSEQNIIDNSEKSSNLDNTSDDSIKVDDKLPEEPNPGRLPNHVRSDENILHQEIETEMKTSFLDYAMSVIVSRAIPDIRDGLKPVHRRILYAMNELGMYHNKAFKKCARIVGEVLGKYHPHGDQAVYDSLVRMVQPFSLRYPLIQGQGNFGSIDGDSAAAMRYTEARMSKMAEEMLADIEKNTVAFMDNFDGSLKEPVVIPSKFPNLLVNGSSGIAVGMATNVPSHNITEVCKSVIKIIDNPDVDLSEIMEIMPGPDFPTGATIIGKKGIYDAYSSGRGKVKIRAKTHYEQHKEYVRIIVDETPYQVNKAMLIEQIADLVKDKRIPDIRDLRDESDRKGTRIVIELKKSATQEVVLNQLMKHSRLQVTFGVIMLSLDNQKPSTYGLIPVIKHYIKHRQIVVRKRTEYELNKAKKRAHILDGLLIALNNIEKVIQLIRASSSVDVAKSDLISNFELSDAQAQAILEMRLQKLAGLERQKIKDEHDNLMKLIIDLESILASVEKINDIIKNELQEIIDKYGDDRRTEIIEADDEDIDYEDLIAEHDVVVTITQEGYIKRLPVETYRQQNRGGRGIIGTNMKDEDIVTDVFVTSTHNYILFFSNKGKVYWQKVYQIPEGSRQSKGRPIVNMIRLEDGEKINAWICVKEFSDNFNLVLGTKNGIVKKSSMANYSKPRKGGIIAINLDDNDSLINAVMTDGDQNILMATKGGLAIKFHEKDARVIGRTSRGVKGITLNSGDEVIGMVIARDDMALLTITENGYGKRTNISEYRKINRGGKGVINIQCSERNGQVVTVKPVIDEDDVIVISKNGIIIRMPIRGIGLIGRNTQGVRLMKMASDDKVVAAAKVVHHEDDDDEFNENSDNDDSTNSESIASKSVVDDENKSDVSSSETTADATVEIESDQSSETDEVTSAEQSTVDKATTSNFDSDDGEEEDIVDEESSDEESELENKRVAETIDPDEVTNLKSDIDRPEEE